jgi:transcriptional regulator with XRE-family HTH domain
MRFGEYLAEGLAKAGYTQSSFAQKVGQKQPAISAIVLGKRAPPLKHVSRWAEVLGKVLDKSTFMELARLENSPLEIQELITELRQRLGKYERK